MRMPLRRRVVVAQRSQKSGPAFLSIEYSADKQQVRDVTAQAFARHIDVPEPLILCMPHYEALCAKTINNLLPSSVFVGIERYKDIGENVAEIVPGKKIFMHKMLLRQYIDTDPDDVQFDAAFLDYVGDYKHERGEEVARFIRKKMKGGGVVAVTMQGNAEKVIQLTQHVQDYARNSGKPVFTKVYQTSARMCHTIFLLKRRFSRV
jgi:hypothetical protein